MRILILGAGKMGSFFTDILSFQHETAVFDVNPHQLRFVYNTYRFTTLEEIKEFEPELVINAVTVKYTLDAFRKVLPVLPKDCIISDIASVKTGLKKFYEESGFRYVSSHPMFGPTFASLSNLSSENAIIISEGDHLGKIFFKDLYQTLRLNIFEYTFDEHDETVAYSLSIPFVSTFVFAAVMKHQKLLRERRKLQEVKERAVISCSKDIYELFHPLMCDLELEEFWVLLMNQANKVIDRVRISTGGISGTLVDVRSVLREALLQRAAQMAVVHNHPSGNNHPSREDEALTQRIFNAAGTMDIKLVDHVIVCDGKYYSFADEGLV